MSGMLHITSGDIAGASLRQAGLPGEFFVWHDILYDGPKRPAGWPDDATLQARAGFIEAATGGGLGREKVVEVFRAQYRVLANAASRPAVVLWFDACLFDQAMLAHILACLRHQDGTGANLELLCIDAFPGIERYNGLGQLSPAQLAASFPGRRPVSAAQLDYAIQVDAAFASQDPALLRRLAAREDAPLPWVPAAVRRWLQEFPDPATGLGRLETMALAAVRAGHETPAAVFAAVAAADTPPQYWGDTTLWAKINALARRQPPLLRIEGPAPLLPQWESPLPLSEFRIKPV